MNCNLIYLKEQKYMGVKTKVFFKDHDKTNFLQLQLDVINSPIHQRDSSARFMAMDSDFEQDSFCYTPLIPVTSFEEGDYIRFTRKEGEYYCFEVRVKELGPQWFQDCAAYITQNNLKIERDFDLEYYSEDFLMKVGSPDFIPQDQTIELIFKKKIES